MTISSTRGTELNVDTIVTKAWNLAGLVNINTLPSEKQLELGRTYLDSIIDELETDGVQARRVTFTEITLVAGAYKYSLDSSVLDVVGNGMYIAPGEDTEKATSETLVTQIRRERWHELSPKSSSSRPTMFYLHRAAVPLEVRFWPIPDVAGTIRLQTHTLSADTLKGNVTLDARVFWRTYFLWELAHWLTQTSSLPVGSRSYVAKRAKEYRDRAKAHSKQHIGVQVHVDHRTPWSR